MPGLPQTGSSLASAYKVLGLQLCTNTLGKIMFFFFIIIIIFQHGFLCEALAVRELDL